MGYRDGAWWEALRVVNNVLLCVVLILGGLRRCWHYFSPNGITKERREREEEARSQIEAYERRNHDGDSARLHVYEVLTSGSTVGKGEGYGHGELRLRVSKTPDGDGRRAISGCGMRQLSYTEVVHGFLALDGTAEWTEKLTREISYSPPVGSESHRSPKDYLPRHWGPASITSKGTFGGDGDNMRTFEGQIYGRDECDCQRCRMFWARWSEAVGGEGTGSGQSVAPCRSIYGEEVRWAPAKERRKIGEYILFRLKDGTSQGRDDPKEPDESDPELGRDYQRMV